MDPDKAKQNPLQKLKALFMKKKKVEEKAESEVKDAEDKTKSETDSKDIADEKSGGDGVNVTDSVKKRKKGDKSKDSDKKSWWLKSASLVLYAWIIWGVVKIVVPSPMRLN